MQVDNNLNTMKQLTNDLDKSAHEVARLNLTSQNALKNAQLNITEKQKEPINEPDLVKEMVNQIQIPIAYDANAEVISTQDSTTQTLLDIKA